MISIILYYICNIRESESRKIIFEILKQSKITKRLNLSDKFWLRFEIQNENTRNVIELMRLRISVMQIFARLL